MTAGTLVKLLHLRQCEALGMRQWKIASAWAKWDQQGCVCPKELSGTETMEGRVLIYREKGIIF